jgi:hypothetical protein
MTLGTQITSEMRFVNAMGASIWRLRFGGTKQRHGCGLGSSRALEFTNVKIYYFGARLGQTAEPRKRMCNHFAA